MKLGDFFTPDENYPEERAKAALADHLGLQIVLEPPEFYVYIISSTIYDLDALGIRTRYHYREFSIDAVLADISDAIMREGAAK